jgi:membrane protease subunit HflC
MQTEREREAAGFRAEGAQKALEIRAKADRDVTVTVAQANSQAETIRGQGDAESNAIYAQAFGQDPRFFAFYRSMRAYQKSMAAGNTNLVLGPNLDFFRYFGNPSGEAPVESATAPSASVDPHAVATEPAK